MNTFREYLKRYSPFTITGYVVLGGSIYLIGTGFATGNAYSFLLATLGLAVLIVVAIVSRLEARRAASSRIEWELTAPLVTRQRKNIVSFRNHDYKSLPFFRVHLRLNGKIKVGENATLLFRREISSQGESIRDAPLYAPLSGAVDIRGMLLIKDVFGFSRAPIGVEEEKITPALPAFVTDRDSTIVEAQTGEESKSRMRSSEIERYFMREYIPGDRQRDINWKASSRFKELYTRISPMTQEKTQLITIYFRPYNSLPSDNLKAVALLDRCKSMLMYFIRTVHANNPSYQFQIFIGTGKTELKDEDDIEQFAEEVASIRFRRYEPTGGEAPEPGIGAYVFTTSCDTGIGEFLATLPPGQVNLYRARFPEKNDDPEKRYRCKLFSDIDDLMIGGRWLVTGFPNGKNPALGERGELSIDDEPVEVRFA